MNKDVNLTKIDSNLKKAIKDNKLIVFAGAGVTKYLEFPTWKDFTIKMLEDLSATGNKRTYSPIIKKLVEDRCTPDDAINLISAEHQDKVFSHIRDTFKIRAGKQCELHKTILQLSEKIITTNYDNAFETAYEIIHGGARPYVVNGNINRNRRQLRDITSNKHIDNFILKIHGCATQPESCIVFKNQYEEFYETNSVITVSYLEQLVRDYTLLFVGWSFRDQYVKKLIDKQCEGLCKKHYIITTSPDDYSCFNYIKPIVVSDYGESLEKLFCELKNYKKSELTRRLRASNLFRDVSDVTVDKIAKNSLSIGLKKGDELVSRGEASDVFWIILEGTLKVMSKGTRTIYRGENDIVGELGFVLQANRERTMKCEEDDTRVLSISQKLMSNIPMEDRTAIWINIVRELVRKKTELQNENGDETIVWKQIAEDLANSLRIHNVQGK